ncbi:MAG: transglutaminase domain-containing protein, partial [Candidatus Diapherotrites archaeon]|nr:transglutaminase domain-containing protein [Candidatus Diapherotrites archaeon]
MRKCCVLVVSALFLLLPVMSIALSPINAGSAEISLVLDGQSNGRPIYLPINDERQQVKYPSDLEIFDDRDGNKLVNTTGNYSFRFNVFVDGSKPVFWDEPFPEENTDNYSEFLGNSSLIIVDESTREFSLRIIGDTNSTLEAVKRLAVWVNEHITYEPNKDMITSNDVMRDRRGSCTEYANLYAALARSAGIPTRIVVGVANTGRGWVSHAWAESLVSGKWVPVDPTYLEVGTKNALSVKLYSGPSVSGYLGRSENAEVEDYSAKPFELPLDVQVSISDDVLAPRQKFSVDALITNKGKSIVIPTYLVQKGRGITSIGPFRRPVIVGPGETKSVSWEFLAPYGEMDEYVLFFRGPDVDKNFTITVNPSLNIEEEKPIEIEEVFTRGEQGKLYMNVTVMNTGNTDLIPNLRVITPVGVKQKQLELNSGESKTAAFIFSAEPGNYTYTVAVTYDGKTITESGSARVVKPPPVEQKFLVVVGKYINRYPVYSFVILVVVVLVFIALIYPLVNRPKRPFEERGRWHRLIKIKKT